MVGEAAVHVQGASLKIAAFPSLRNFQLPDHQGRSLVLNLLRLILILLLSCEVAFAQSIKIEQAPLKNWNNYSTQTLAIINSSEFYLVSAEIECGFFRENQLLDAERNIAHEIAPGQTAYINVISSDAPGATRSECRLFKIKKSAR